MADDRIKGKSWSRIPGETGKAYAAFAQYLKLGKERSIAKALAASGTRPGNHRHWERWASKNRWVARAEAYDVDQLHEQIAGRHVGRELVRQMIVDQGAQIMAELRELSIGKVRRGEQKFKLGRDGKPQVTLVENPNEPGEFIDVAVTEELVTPKVRAQILEHLLGLQGLMAPVRQQIEHVDGPAEELRAALRDIDPEVMLALANALGVER